MVVPFSHCVFYLFHFRFKFYCCTKQDYMMPKRLLINSLSKKIPESAKRNADSPAEKIITIQIVLDLSIFVG